MERCQSGRMGHPAKVLAVKTARGFESLPLRQHNLLSESTHLSMANVRPECLINCKQKQRLCGRCFCLVDLST